MFNIFFKCLSSNDILVVNCTSGPSNPISYRDFLDLVVKHSRANPSEYTVLYPHIYLPMSPIVHDFLDAVHTFLPAYLTDQVLYMSGKPAMAVKMHTKIKKVTEMSKLYFSNP